MMIALTRPRSSRLGARAALVALVVAGCGGRSLSTGERDDESEPLGPVHQGKGEYHLTIETLASDCEPPLATGDLGRVIVYVMTGAGQAGATIPYFGMWPDLGPVRWDVDLLEPVAWEREIVFSPPCGELIERFEIAPLRADSERIDVEWTWRIRGVETCPREPTIATRDCVSQQVFRFRWLRACVGENVLEPCVGAMP